MPKEAKTLLKRLNDYPREESRASIKIGEGYSSQLKTAKSSEVDNILTLAQVYLIVNNCQERQTLLLLSILIVTLLPQLNSF